MPIGDIGMPLPPPAAEPADAAAGLSAPVGDVALAAVVGEDRPWALTRSLPAEAAPLPSASSPEPLPDEPEPP